MKNHLEAAHINARPHPLTAVKMKQSSLLFRCDVNMFSRESDAIWHTVSEITRNKNKTEHYCETEF